MTQTRFSRAGPYLYIIQLYFVHLILVSQADASNFYSSGGMTSYHIPGAALDSFAGADASSSSSKVSKGPRFTSLPPSRLNFLNTVGATLDCVATSFTPITYKWLANGEIVSEVMGYREILRNGSLYFPPFNLAMFRRDIHETEYFCEVVSDYGSIISHPISVQALISTEQRFTIAVQDEVTSLGSNVRFSYKIGPPFVATFVHKVEWLNLRSPSLTNGSNYTEVNVTDDRIDVLHDGSLFIREVTEEDSLKWYKCVGTHSVTQSKVQSQTESIQMGPRGAQIVLQDSNDSGPPLMYYSQVDIVAQKGDRVKLVCATHGSPPASSFKWFKNGKRLNEQTDDKVEWEASGMETSTVYQCEASNSVGSSSMEFSVTIKGDLKTDVKPRITKVDVGSTLNLTCSFLKDSVVNLKWFLNGMLIEETKDVSYRESNTLTVKNLSIEQFGVYQCQIFDGGDSYLSGYSEVQLKERKAQVYESFEEKVYEPMLDSITLECRAFGNPLPVIDWYHNEKMIPIATQDNKYLQISRVVGPFSIASRLNVNPVVLLDSGIYTCKAANMFGSDVASNYIHIKGSPDVLPMPDRVVLATGVTRLPCYVAGYPIEEITWYHDGRKMPYDYRQLVSNNGTLAIRDTAVQDQGTYTCEAKAAGFLDSSSFNVVVKTGPQISAFQFEDAVLNERLGVICSAHRGDMPIEIKWYKDGKKIDSGKDQFIIQFLPPTTSYLSIEQIKPFHAGNYTCVVSNEVASVTHTSALRVKIPPYFTEEPVDTSVLLGSTIEIPCVVIGNPEPTVTWEAVLMKTGHGFEPLISQPLGVPGTAMYEYTPLTGKVLVQLKQDMYVSPGNGSLIIRNASLDVPRNLLCRASNGIGREAAKSISLRLQVPPFLRSRNGTQTSRIGQSATISCEAYGDTPLAIVWSRDNVSLAESPSYSKYQVEMLRTTNSTISSIKISSTTRKDSAIYTCVASNAFGVASRSVLFKVLELPEPPRDVNIVSTNSTAVEITWHLGFNGNSPLDHILILYSQVASFSSTSSSGGSEGGLIRGVPDSRLLPDEGGVYLQQQLKLPANATRVVIPNLKPASLYKMQISTVNPIGISQNSPMLSVRTNEDAPSAPPEDFKAEAVSSSSVRISWKQPKLESRNGIIILYEIVYFNVKKPSDEIRIETSANNQLLTSLQDNPHQEIDLEDLELFTSYNIRMRAKTSSGFGPFTKQAVVSTFQGVPSVAPTNLVITSSIKKSILIKFDAIPDNEVNGVLLGYKVKYFPTKDPSSIIFYPSLDRSILLSHVEPFTNYTISVCGYTSVGDGIYTTPTVVQTAEAPPGPPEKIKVVVKSSKSILVSWMPPKQPMGIIHSYRVCFEKQAIVARRGAACVELKRALFEYVKTDAELGEAYFVWVSAINNAGEGAISEKKQVTTGFSASIPAKIYSFSRSLTVTWKDDVTLDCEFVGFPEPAVSWYKSGISQPLGGTSLGSLTAVTENGDSPKYTLMPNNSLLIKSTTEKDSGIYTCAIANMDYSDSINYTLNVLAPPKQPVAELHKQTNDSITIGWRQMNEITSHVTKYLVQYRPIKKQGSEKNDWITETVKSNEGFGSEKVAEKMRSVGFSGGFTAKNLVCGSSYEFSVTSFNAVGRSLPSDTLVLSTRGKVPVNPAIDEIIAETASTSILLNLTKIDNGQCQLNSIVIQLRKVGDENQMARFSSSSRRTSEQKENSSGVTSYKVSGNKANYLLSELDPATYYEMTLMSKNSAGVSQDKYLFGTHTIAGKPVPDPDTLYTGGDLGGTVPVSATVVGVGGAIALMGLICLCACLICLIKATKEKKKRRLHMKAESKARVNLIQEIPPDFAGTLGSDIQFIQLQPGHKLMAGGPSSKAVMSRKGAYLQEMAANARSGSRNSLIMAALNNSGPGSQPPYQTYTNGDISMHATQPNLSNLGGVTDTARVLPETSNPLFLSHGNLAVSLGLSGQPHQMAHVSSLARNLGSVAPTSQANSASNLASMFPSTTNPRPSLHNSYYPPLGPSTISGSVDTPGFATGVGGQIRPSNSLRTFLNEKGDDSGIDEDGDQSPPPDERGNRVQTSGPANPGTSTAGSGGVYPDNQRANILKEELRKHMLMQPTTVVLPSSVPSNHSFPHSTSFSGPFSPLGATTFSSVPQAMIQLPRRNSVMSANDEIPTSRSLQFGGDSIGPPPVPPRDPSTSGAPGFSSCSLLGSNQLPRRASSRTLNSTADTADVPSFPNNMPRSILVDSLLQQQQQPMTMAGETLPRTGSQFAPRMLPSNQRPTLLLRNNSTASNQSLLGMQRPPPMYLPPSRNNPAVYNPYHPASLLRNSRPTSYNIPTVGNSNSNMGAARQEESNA